MGVFLVIALAGSQPVGGKLHETVLRAGIVGMWRLNLFGEPEKLGPTDPVIGPVWLFRSNGRYIWAHQNRNRPRILRGGRYEIVGNKLKEFGNPGAEMPDGVRMVSMPDRDTLRIDFTNGRDIGVNILLRINATSKLVAQERRHDEFAQALRWAVRVDDKQSE
jgi:hypothetical protein